MDVDVADATDVNDYVNRYITGDYDITTAGLFAMLDPWFEYTRRYRSDSPLNGTGFASPALDDALDVGEAIDRSRRAQGGLRHGAAGARRQPRADVHPRRNTAPSSRATPSRAGARSSVPTASAASATLPSSCVADEFWRNDG